MTEKTRLTKAPDPKVDVAALIERTARWIEAAIPRLTDPDMRADAARDADALRAMLARIEELEGACRIAAQQFRAYERIHRAKGTPDGNVKAATNADMADHLETALSKDSPS